MFQAMFPLPHRFDLTRQLHEEWKRDLLVHVAIETVYGQGGQPTHEIAILSSFEFCVNNVYQVRSMMLGYNKSNRTSGYEFMKSVQSMIPVCLHGGWSRGDHSHFRAASSRAVASSTRATPSTTEAPTIGA